jgi:hypothetical protein
MAEKTSKAQPAKKRQRYWFEEYEEPVLTEADIAAMPDPLPLLPALATSVVEVIAGARPVDHLASLLSDQVYEKLRARVAQKARSDANQGRPALMPKFAVTRVHSESPALGVIESVVLLTGNARTRAVTIRLEPIRKRWRATNVSVL